MIKKIKYLLFLILLSFIFIPKDTYADGLNNVPTGAGSFRYYINSDGTGSWNGYYPQELLTSSTSYEKYLYYITTGLPDLSNDYSGLYYSNSVRATLQLHRMGNQGVMDWHQNIPMKMVCMSNEQTPQNGNCGVKSANNQYITFECMCTYNHNEYPISADIQIGTYNFTHGSTTWIGRTIRTSDSSLYIQALQYEATSSGGNSGDSGTDLSETNEKLDNIDEGIGDINEGIGDINESINDSTVPNANDTSDFFDDLLDVEVENPIANIITLPLSFTQQMLHILETGSDDGCERVKLMTFSGPWFDNSVDIYLPCFNGEEIFGTTMWTIIDYLIIFYMVYNIAMLFVDIYHDFITLSVGLSSASHVMNTNSSQTSPYGRR